MVIFRNSLIASGNNSTPSLEDFTAGVEISRLRSK